MAQISSLGCLPLSIWIRYFGLGHARAFPTFLIHPVAAAGSPSRLICPFGVGLPRDAPSTRPGGGEAAAAAPETSVFWRILWSVAGNFDTALCRKLYSDQEALDAIRST